MYTRDAFRIGSGCRSGMFAPSNCACYLCSLHAHKCIGYLDFDKESEDLLRDSDDDGGGGGGMADEIANMLADLRTTGEAEDDANVDFSLVC